MLLAVEEGHIFYYLDLLMTLQTFKVRTLSYRNLIGKFWHIFFFFEGVYFWRTKYQMATYIHSNQCCSDLFANAKNIIYPKIKYLKVSASLNTKKLASSSSSFLLGRKIFCRRLSNISESRRPFNISSS